MGLISKNYFKLTRYWRKDTWWFVPLEKVYFRSQILERPSIDEYWNISFVPVLPENVIFTSFRMCWCYSEAYNTGTQKWSSIVQYSCTSIWDLKHTFSAPFNPLEAISQKDMLLIPNALCWSSRKCNCTSALLLVFICRSWQKFFVAKNLLTAQMQLHQYSEQQRAFGISNICYQLKRRF